MIGADDDDATSPQGGGAVGTPEVGRDRRVALDTRPVEQRSVTHVTARTMEAVMGGGLGVQCAAPLQHHPHHPPRHLNGSSAIVRATTCGTTECPNRPRHAAQSRRLRLVRTCPSCWEVVVMMRVGGVVTMARTFGGGVKCWVCRQVSGSPGPFVPCFSSDGDEEKVDMPVEKPNFGLSGALAKDERHGNMYRGVQLKWSEPADACMPKRHWRLYIFKKEEMLGMHSIVGGRRYKASSFF